MVTKNNNSTILAPVTKHPFAIQRPIIDEICKPLSKIGVGLFAHGIVFPNNSFTGVVTSNNWFKSALVDTKCVQYIDLACNFDKLTNFATISRITDLHWQMPESLKAAFIDCLHKNSNYYQVYIAVKTKLLFESFWFTTGSKSTVNDLRKDYDQLYKFILNYKQQVSTKSSSIYNTHDFSQRYKNTNPDYCCFPTAKDSSNANIMTNGKNLYLPGLPPKQYLTKQEFKCAKYILVERNSAKETAAILQISVRTVQKHLGRVRKKFKNCLDDLIAALLQSNRLL